METWNIVMVTESSLTVIFATFLSVVNSAKEEYQ